MAAFQICNDALSPMYRLPLPSTATALGEDNPLATSVVTCCVDTDHFLITLLAVSAIYRLPAPSAATPFGKLKPPEIGAFD